MVVHCPGDNVQPRPWWYIAQVTMYRHDHGGTLPRGQCTAMEVVKHCPVGDTPPWLVLVHCPVGDIPLPTVRDHEPDDDGYDVVWSHPPQSIT